MELHGVERRYRTWTLFLHWNRVKDQNRSVYFKLRFYTFNDTPFTEDKSHFTTRFSGESHGTSPRSRKSSQMHLHLKSSVCAFSCFMYTHEHILHTITFLNVGSTSKKPSRFNLIREKRPQSQILIQPTFGLKQ